MENLEIRAYEIRAVNDEKREITGIAVPYDDVATVGDYSEKFERGAISDVNDTKLFWNHQEPIGRIVGGEDTETGYTITAKISDTTEGRDAWTLVKDGVVNKFSVGFIPVEHRMDGDTVVRTKVQLKEVSLVPFPAYEGASLTQIRSQVNDSRKADHNIKENVIMENNINAPEVAELREAVGDLERRLASSLEKGNEKPVVEMRSGGELLKALANGDDVAKRAFTGATTADSGTGSAWVNKTLTLVEENRNVLNLFNRSALPATGNSVEYPFVSATTGTVGEQAAEGDDLSYMEVVIGTGTAPVKTYGGYSSLSRQAIERSDVAYLDAVLRFQAQQYAKATNSAVRTAVANATGTSTVAALAADTGQAWLTTVLAARRAVKAANSQAAVLVVSPDVYDRLFTIVDTAGRPVFNLNGDGSNTFGDANLVSVSGSIAGLPVVIDDAAAANTAWVLGRDAITVFEQPGAPVRLQDENVINLTKDFSLYGYLAVAPTNAAAIVRLDVDLVV